MLVIDPDEALRRLVRNWLEARDYLVLDAGNPGDAERIARLYVGPIHLLVIELPVSAAAGRDLVDRLQTSHAELQILFTSAQSQQELVRKRELAAGWHFMRKPFSEEQLVLRVDKILARTS